MNKYLTLTFLMATVFYMPMLVFKMTRFRPFIFTDGFTKPEHEDLTNPDYTKWHDSRYIDQ